MRSLSKFIFFTMMGWKIEGSFPDLKKYVIIAVPHTSWHDFYIGLLLRNIAGIDINYVGKKELFKPPMGWYFRMTGGVPVDRAKRSNMVDAVVDIFNEKDEFRLTLAPEGTRKKVDTWKTGFYHIAKGAGVPIVMVAFDFGKRTIKISEPFHPTDDQEADFQYMYSFFKGVKGKVAANSFDPS
ncbi:lysophospholipid acyltransferase family protein [Robertkochia aurantiaca]|uniref:lysophospholipid acyltransferase family protein n=1 Tax=Robertkochia aurantiaca TaxID=2873700 RepID=UPI001CC97988|nr:lysophospholipid acyltransferase family protein [Robertkochia sp. 3YJGBD-33]